MVHSSDVRIELFQRLCREVLAGRSRVGELEGQFLDCKEDPSKRGAGGATEAGDARSDPTAKAVADAAACFACADGGIVVIGVDDKQVGPSAFIGTRLDTSWLTNRVRQLIGIEVVVAEHDVDGRRLVTVTVEPSSTPVHDSHNRYRRRQGRDCHEMTGAELGTFSVARETTDWSGAPSSFTTGDASPTALEHLRRWLRTSSESSRVDLAHTGDAQLLQTLGLAVPGGQLNRAGELFVVDVPGREPLLDLSCRPAAGADTEYRYDPPALCLATALADTEVAIDARNPVYAIPNGLSVGQVLALPKLAYREALVNALMHRNWSRPEPVRVELEGTHLTVTSPGGFLPGVTEETVLTAPARTRNRRLASAFRGLRLAEAEGSGVDRMFREAVSLGLPKPTIRQLVDGSAIRCVIIGGVPDQTVIRVVLSLPSPHSRDVDILLLLDALMTQPSINATAFAPMIQKTHSEAVAALRRAFDVGLVVETTRIGQFRLSDEHRETLRARLRYLRRTAADYEDLIRRFVAEQGEIRARDIIELTGVSQARASGVLNYAVDTGVIVKQPSPNAVGAGVYYTSPS